MLGSPIKDIDEFWTLTLKPETADTRLSTVPVVVISRKTLQLFFRELRETIGPGADEILYRSGLEAGQAFVATMTEWAGSKSPIEVVDQMGDIYSRCGWFAAESLEVDPMTHQARLRMKRTLETYGTEGRQGAPACHFLRGYFAGLFRSLFWTDKVECWEITCRGKGDEFCEFVVADGLRATRELP